MYKAKSKTAGDGNNSSRKSDIYGDVNRDGKMGLEELVYILRKLAGL